MSSTISSATSTSMTTNSSYTSEPTWPRTTDETTPAPTPTPPPTLSSKVIIGISTAAGVIVIVIIVVLVVCCIRRRKPKQRQMPTPKPPDLSKTYTDERGNTYRHDAKGNRVYVDDNESDHGEEYLTPDVFKEELRVHPYNATKPRINPSFEPDRYQQQSTQGTRRHIDNDDNIFENIHVNPNRPIPSDPAASRGYGKNYNDTHVQIDFNEDYEEARSDQKRTDTEDYDNQEDYDYVPPPPSIRDSDLYLVPDTKNVIYQNNPVKVHQQIKTRPFKTQEHMKSESPYLMKRY